MGEGAHLAYIDLAQKDEDGEDGYGDECEHAVHREEVEESADEHGEHGEGVGEGLGEKSDHGLHVLLKTVDDVAAVITLTTLPLGSQQVA